MEKEGAQVERWALSIPLTLPETLKVPTATMLARLDVELVESNSRRRPPPSKRVA